jgi:hypothetical protein
VRAAGQNGHPHPVRPGQIRESGLAEGKDHPRSALKISKSLLDV